MPNRTYWASIKNVWKAKAGIAEDFPTQLLALSRRASNTYQAFYILGDLDGCRTFGDALKSELKTQGWPVEDNDLARMIDQFAGFSYQAPLPYLHYNLLNLQDLFSQYK